jgi:hypothetical protein
VLERPALETVCSHAGTFLQPGPETGTPELDGHEAPIRRLGRLVRRSKALPVSLYFGSRTINGNQKQQTPQELSGSRSAWKNKTFL